MATRCPREGVKSIHTRGNAVFIINEEPVKAKSGVVDFEVRKGAKCDSENLHAVFIHKLGFDLMNAGSHLNMNLTIDKWDHNKPSKKEIPEGSTCSCLCCTIKSKNYSNCNSFVLAVSSHGRTLKEGPAVLFTDGHPLLVSEMMDALSDENCPTLKGKPRILIMQMCRSSSADADKSEDRGNLDLRNAQHSQPLGDQSGEADESDQFTGVEEEYELTSTALLKEFLVVYASPKGKRAKRKIATGSWMLNELKRVVDSHDINKDPMNILKILTQVNMNVSLLETIVNKKDELNEGETVMDEEKSGLKNSICIEHMLTEPLIFYPMEKEDVVESIPLPDFLGSKKKKSVNKSPQLL